MRVDATLVRAFSRAFNLARLELVLEDGSKLWFEDVIQEALDFWDHFFRDNGNSYREITQEPPSYLAVTTHVRRAKETDQRAMPRAGERSTTPKPCIAMGAVRVAMPHLWAKANPEGMPSSSASVSQP